MQRNSKIGTIYRKKKQPTETIPEEVQTLDLVKILDQLLQVSSKY